MKNSFILYLALFVLFLSPTILKAQTTPCPTPEHISGFTLAEMDTLKLSTCNCYELILLVGAAEQMALDTSFEVAIKADLSFDIIANELQIRKKLAQIDPADPCITFLADQLKKQQYHLALNQPSDFEKLLHYMKEGRWEYIWKRFFDRGYHVYALLLIIMVPITHVIRKRTKKKDNSLE